MGIAPYIADRYDRLQFLMKKSGKSGAEIADFIGVTREHLYKYIKEKKLAEDKIEMILSFIGVSLEDFETVPKIQSKDQALELMRSALTRLDQIETDIQLLKKLVLQKGNDQ